MDWILLNWENTVCSPDGDSSTGVGLCFPLKLHAGGSDFRLWWFQLKDFSIDQMVRAWCFGCCQAHQGLLVGFLLLRYSVLFIVESLSLLYLIFIATNQRVVAAKRQQRGLVAVTIRGSVLFYSSAIWRPDFRSVNREFRYLYGVDSIELKTLFYRWKMCRNHH